MRSILAHLAIAGLLGGLALLPGAAQAMKDNLYQATLCLARGNQDIDIAEPGDLDPDRFGDLLFEDLKSWLTNAGTPFLEEDPGPAGISCNFSPSGLYVYLGAIAGDTRAWMIKLDVSDDSGQGYRSWVEIWSHFEFGTATSSGQALGEYLRARLFFMVFFLTEDFREAN